MEGPGQDHKVISRGARLNFCTSLSRSGRQRLEIWCPLKILVLVQCSLGGLKHFLNFVTGIKLHKSGFLRGTSSTKPCLFPKLKFQSQCGLHRSLLLSGGDPKTTLTHAGS